jgi:hypothetical protein
MIWITRLLSRLCEPSSRWRVINFITSPRHWVKRRRKASYSGLIIRNTKRHLNRVTKGQGSLPDFKGGPASRIPIYREKVGDSPFCDPIKISNRHFDPEHSAGEKSPIPCSASGDFSVGSASLLRSDVKKKLNVTSNEESLPVRSGGLARL